MKQRILIPAFLIIVTLCSCSGPKVISGPVTAIDGNLITVNGVQYKVRDTIPTLGQDVTLTGTVVRKKMNARQVRTKKTK